MVTFWDPTAATGPGFTGSPKADTSKAAIRELEYQVARLQLMNQALWELVREKAGLTDSDLEQKAHEVDMRDGIEDGKITDRALKCPNCGRVSSSKHWKCLYCGLEFQKPVMG